MHDSDADAHRRTFLRTLALAAAMPSAAYADAALAAAPAIPVSWPPRAARNCQELYQQLASMDPGARARDINYALSTSDRPNGAFWINAPFDDWSAAPEIPSTSPFSRALRGAVAQGIVYDRCFIDLFNLGDGDAGLLGDAALQPNALLMLADHINALPLHVSPTIRYLTGYPDHKGFVPDGLVHGIFSGLIRHPKATMYVGAYQPVRQFAIDETRRLARLKRDILDHGFQVLAEADRSKFGALTEAAGIFGAQFRSSVEDAISLSLPPVSWNHAKIFAMNGTSLVTGGINYWAPEYASHPSSTVLDLSALLTGPATVKAHQFADAIWRYLNALPAQDKGSWAKSARIIDGVDQFKDCRATPMFTRRAASPADHELPSADTDRISTLSVTNFGQWPHADGTPSLYLTAIRDVFIAMVDALAVSRFQNRGHELTAHLAHRMNELTDPAFAHLLLNHGVNPAHWSSRSARAVAVASASKRLRLSQQSLVDAYGMSSTAFSSMVKQFNTLFGTNWDGRLWPWELLGGIAYGCAGMLRAQGSAHVDLVMSYADGGWDDDGTPEGLRARLTAYLTMLQSAGSIDPIADTPAFVARSVNYRRVVPGLTNDGNHAKAIIVDDALAYIGSDNAYPNYNIQHGIWLDDTQALLAYIAGYWDPLWSKYSVPS
ncbi:hypothetical protein PV762_18895 [Mitsuaria sp. CC2]|uniref:hypothetical protein n=1 Tax=Mitsuaria sp. CC2 TaxID=3029186 RepID=UPI003B8CC38B